MENGEIKLEELAKEREDYLTSSKHKVLRHALSQTKLSQVVRSDDKAAESDFIYSYNVKTLPVSNQKRSGRCWIFSASNLLREMIAKKTQMKMDDKIHNGNFEISQNYISFYDKLEKINYTLEGVISLLDEKPDDRKLMFLLQNGVGDGGQWDMYVSIVKKYGICPKSAYKENAQSDETKDSNAVINTSIKKFAYDAQKLYKESGDLNKVRVLKDEYMLKAYAFLVDCFGLPPTSFDFEYISNDGGYKIERNLTPKSFFDKYIGSEIDEYVSIINAPTKDKEYYQTYNIELLGNVIGGKKVTHLNLPMERFKELVVKQLKAGELVWFGSDVSKFGNREEGVWDQAAFDYETPFDLELDFAKDGMLDYHDSMMNHAMVLTGFDEKDGKIIRWKIENSWGEANGNKGFYQMSSAFFDHYVYQAAIKKEFLGKEELEAIKKTAVLLPPWDPFGTLAD
ncbi:MAG: C1 family peptidase [Bacilli bacterium]|jgi:bleomycin hydrolase|nr:C1 family peptidase [Bacilli bacterium]